MCQFYWLRPDKSYHLYLYPTSCSQTKKYHPRQNSFILDFQSAMVRTGRIIRTGEDVPRLTSCYVRRHHETTRRCSAVGTHTRTTPSAWPGRNRRGRVGPWLHDLKGVSQKFFRNMTEPYNQDIYMRRSRPVSGGGDFSFPSCHAQDAVWTTHRAKAALRKVISGIP